MVLHYVKPFLSQEDIEAGKRWGDAIAKELETTTFGIVCLTRENINSPWVLFEAGALAKSMPDSRVVPLLLDFDFKEITGPLAQFQAKKVEKGGVSEIVHSVNKQTPNSPVSESQASRLFEALWPELEKALAAIPKQASPAKHTRPQPEILEELVAGVRSLESRFREADEKQHSLRSRKKRFHPKMIEAFVEHIDVPHGDPVRWLIVASILREDAPWLYELTAHAYRSATTGSPEDAKRACQRLLRAIKTFRHSPFFPEEIGLDPYLLHILTRELERDAGLEEDVEKRLEEDIGKRLELGPYRLKVLKDAGFATLRDLDSASPDDIAAVEGIGQKLAINIKEQLRRLKYPG